MWKVSRPPGGRDGARPRISGLVEGPWRPRAFPDHEEVELSARDFADAAERAAAAADRLDAGDPEAVGADLLELTTFLSEAELLLRRRDEEVVELAAERDRLAGRLAGVEARAARLAARVLELVRAARRDDVQRGRA